MAFSSATVSVGGVTRQSDYQRVMDNTVYNKDRISKYSTGWVSNSDWTNGEYAVTHNLNTNLSDLIVKVFISSDGTEANAYEVQDTNRYNDGATSSDKDVGIVIYQNSVNEIKVQTGAEGVGTLTDGAGELSILTTQSDFYKVVVYKLG